MRLIVKENLYNIVRLKQGLTLENYKEFAKQEIYKHVVAIISE